MTYSAPRYPWLALVVLLIICFAVAGLGGLATTPNIPNWYAGLAKPSWTPPAWIFGPVWSVLYLSMAIAA
jgi:translocator protein